MRVALKVILDVNGAFNRVNKEEPIHRTVYSDSRSSVLVCLRTHRLLASMLLMICRVICGASTFRQCCPFRARGGDGQGTWFVLPLSRFRSQIRSSIGTVNSADNKRVRDLIVAPRGGIAHLILFSR